MVIPTCLVENDLLNRSPVLPLYAKQVSTTITFDIPP